MSPQSPREREDEQRRAERAAEWLSVLKTAGETERAEFADWLAESPRHLEEFLFTTAVDRELGKLDLQGNTRIQALLEKASANVVQLRPADSQTLHSRKTRRWGFGVAAALALACVGLWQWQAQRQVYATAVGEQRTVELSDGSVIHLNARSRARVSYSARGRDIQLLDGEAMFKVARDAVRPFRVHSGGSTIQAVGTQFNVLRRPSGTLVSVLEGAVRIDGDAARLGAGEEVKIALDGHIEKQARVDAVTVAAWRRHRLVFRADTLSDIAAEFNRYNRKPQLVVSGDASQLHRYTGVFDADDPQSLLTFLREDRELVLEERGNELVIRPRD